MTPRIGVAVGLAAVVIGGCLALREASARHVPRRESARAMPAEQGVRTEATAEQLAQMERALGSAQARLAQLEARLAASAAPSAAPDPAGKTESPSSDELPPWPSEERDRIVAARERSACEGRLGTERVDPVWAPAKAAEIKDFLGSNVTSRTTEVRCASTLCRIQVEHQDEAARHQFIEGSIGQGPLATSFFFAPSEDGHGTVLYVSREGYNLPAAEI